MKNHLQFCGICEIASKFAVPSTVVYSHITNNQKIEKMSASQEATEETKIGNFSKSAPKN